MLGKADATPMIAVKDLDRAKQFYEEKLGLKPTGTENSEVFMLKSGDTELSVYKSEFAGTNKATLLTFDVDDIEAEVRELKDKGISFEHYDLEGLTADGDIYRSRGNEDRLVQGPGRQYPEPDRSRLTAKTYEAARLTPDRSGEARSCLGRPPRPLKRLLFRRRSPTSREGTKDVSPRSPPSASRCRLPPSCRCR